MSKRETKLMSFYITGNKGMFKTYDEIKKCADALKSTLNYLQKSHHDYFINAFIGMSDLNIRFGELVFEDNKKPGCNKLITSHKKFKGAKEKCGEPWHLHILIEANPGETIGQLVAKYLNKKFKNSKATKVKISQGFFAYVMKQSSKIRFVIETRQTDLLQYNFKDIYEKNYKPLSKRKKTARKKLIGLEKQMGKTAFKLE